MSTGLISGMTANPISLPPQAEHFARAQIPAPVASAPHIWIATAWRTLTARPQARQSSMKPRTPWIMPMVGGGRSGGIANPYGRLYVGGAFQIPPEPCLDKRGTEFGKCLSVADFSAFLGDWGSWVRIPPLRPSLLLSIVPCLVRQGHGWAVSSVGRASRLHRECRRFEPVTAHQQTWLALPAPRLEVRQNRATGWPLMDVKPGHSFSRLMRPC